MKKTLLLAFMVMNFSFLAMPVNAAGRSVDVGPVDVPEQKVETPRPAEIHENIQDTPCSSCHAPMNPDIESKLPSHFVTNKECGTCHYTQRWIPLRIYTHINARYAGSLRKNDADPQDCTACHITNNQFMAK